MPPCLIGNSRIVTAACFTSVAIASVAAHAERPIGYNRDIRPLLSDRCFQCHGPDEGTRQADLRLEERDTALAVIEPGDVDASELVARITSADPDVVMPPPESGKSLTADEIELLKKWVAAGAEYEPHWAFIPPKRPVVPEVEKTDWPEGMIDHFILAQLEEEGLAPSPAADKITLLRRVTFDLTGMPPTRDEVRAFLADNSPDAYERVVDRLLASPRYGEHMARYWLDAVRYGDTHGLHLDNYREMWPYRDWVVRAFNNNMSWDDFTVKQLAGDLLPNATVDDHIASGYNRCHITTNEGGSIAEEVEVRNVVDRVSTTGTVFLGLTMGCAVCHDHKFDPITMRDFYSSYAYFNNLDGKAMDDNAPDPAPVVKAPTPEQTARLESIAAELAQLESQLAGPWPEVDELQTEWEQSFVDERGKDATDDEQSALFASNWYSVGPFRGDVRYLNSRKHGPEGKAIDLAEQFEISTGEKVGWVEQPHWTDGQVINELSNQIAATFVYRRLVANQPQKLAVSLGSDDGIKVYLNKKLLAEEKVSRAAAPDQLKLELPLEEGENHLLLKIVNTGGVSGYYFATPDGPPLIPAGIWDAARLAAEARSDTQEQSLRTYFRMQVCQHEGLRKLLERQGQLTEERVAIEGQIPTTLVMKERAEPAPAYLLKRGQYDLPDEELGALPRRVPSFLPPLPEGAPNDRLGYAQWLIAPEHPLMARVAVNRFWQQCFGTGIVETADDFGAQGSWPTHPGLLEWLAVEFRESGWDTKHLMKLIVMSNTYRQSSQTNPELQRRDPRNRLLARGPRFRLDAEMLRDQALAVSGLLVEKLGGPGVKPPQPHGLWKAVAYVGSNTDTFVADKGPEKVHRRSIYTFWKRTSPPPQMSTLDAPTRESCVVRRERTNTPLAALLLLNDPQYVEAARKLADRALETSTDEGEPSATAKVLFELATLRTPEDDELDTLMRTYEESLVRYEADPEAAVKLLGVGEAPRNEKFAPAEAAAWTLVANTVLNLDEVVTKE